MGLAFLYVGLGTGCNTCNLFVQVRHMSETDATEALLARLSYQASIRAGEVARRAASKFPIQKVAKISLTFCILVSCINMGKIVT